MVYRVYVIQNREGKFYIGLSDDVVRRVEEHNSGQSRWTKGRGPWTIVWQSDELSLSEARKLENRLKRQKGGHGLFHLLEWSARQAHNPASEAGSLVQIQPPNQFLRSRCFFAFTFLVRIAADTRRPSRFHDPEAGFCDRLGGIISDCPKDTAFAGAWSVRVRPAIPFF